MKQRYSFIIAAFFLVFAGSAVSPQTTLALTSRARTANDLIASITQSNIDSSTDTIILTANIVLSTVDNSDSTYGNSGLPTITSDITIEGQGYSITRSANVNTPDFRIFRVAAGGSLTLYNLTVSGGKAMTGTICDAACGGGVLSEGMFTTTHTNFSGNAAEKGGAFYNKIGSTIIADTTFSSNAASNSGGAVYVNFGDVTIKDSIFSHNTADSEGGGIYSVGRMYTNSSVTGSTFFENTSSNGGGIAGDVIITTSTFSGNSASNDGGGVYVTGNADLYVSSSTFSNNTAVNDGGGVFFDSSAGNEGIISNATFFGNMAANGGGLRKIGDPQFPIDDSIIAQSGGGNCMVDNAIPDDSHNLADDASCPNFTDVTATDPVQPLNLDSLADNGGPTQTIALNFPSPALDTGDSGCFSISIDQRGVNRGINAVGAINVPSFGDCDLGAFETNGFIRTLQFASPSSGIVIGATNTFHVPLMLDSALVEARAVTGYVWISGGTAISGVDYLPFGVQAVIIMPDARIAAATITLLNAASTLDKTIILSFATQYGPGFSGAVRLGTQLSHTLTLKTSGANAVPLRNYFITATPTLTWNRVSWATGYEIEVDTDNVFVAPYTFSPVTVPADTLSLQTPPLANGVYYWRVRAQSATGSSNWSPAERFEVLVP